MRGPFSALYCIDECSEQIFTKRGDALRSRCSPRLVMKTFAGAGGVNKVAGVTLRLGAGGVNALLLCGGGAGLPSYLGLDTRLRALVL